MLPESVPRAAQTPAAVNGLRVGDAVCLTELTGEWEAGTSGVLLEVLRTHAIVGVLADDGLFHERIPVGYRSLRRTRAVNGAGVGPPRRRFQAL
jgi:hypothetical protein